MSLLSSLKAALKRMLPGAKPQKTKEQVIKELMSRGTVPSRASVYLVGVRGYYKNTMGKPGVNDRGIYDDAIFLITPEGSISFNANTDPSIARSGVAVLKPGGPYLYKVGIHGISGRFPHQALRQHGDVTVTRDNRPGEFTDSERNRFWINIHKGGYNTTSSEGCQTIHPDQWLSFIGNVKAQMKKHKQDIIAYYLFDEK